MSRVLTAVEKEYKVGDEVLFYINPKQRPGSDPEFHDIKPFTRGKVVRVTTKFTRNGPQEFVPFYDVLLPDGRVMHEADPHYFQSVWPAPRNDLDTAFSRVMKALKPLGLKRTRSYIHANERVLEPGSKPAPAKDVFKLLQAHGIDVDPRNLKFSVDVRITDADFATYLGTVSIESGTENIWRLVLGFSPQVKALTPRLSSRRGVPLMSRSLTAPDRSSLIRLASSLPAGSPERKAILAGLRLQGARVASKRGDIITLTKSIPDFFQEKVVPKGQYQVDKTMRGEVSLRPYPLSAHPGYLVGAEVLAAALS